MKIHNNPIVLTPQITPDRPSQAVGVPAPGADNANAAAETTLRLQQIAQQNVASTHATLIDADKALELATRTSDLILSQPSTAEAAQSGHSAQDVFKLLQN